jgi:hypothetical protein
VAGAAKSFAETVERSLITAISVSATGVGANDENSIGAESSGASVRTTGEGATEPPPGTVTGAIDTCSARADRTAGGGASSAAGRTASTMSDAAS